MIIWNRVIITKHHYHGNQGNNSQYNTNHQQYSCRNPEFTSFNTYNCNGYKILYTNSDDLLIQITDNPQHIILITKVIPKAQTYPQGLMYF